MSPELRFVAACCRWPGDEYQRDQLDRIGRLVRDWDMVAQLTGAHRVEGLVWRAVDRHNISQPQFVAAKLEAMSEAVRNASINNIGETLRISGRLGQAGIEHRIIKGLPLAVSAYGNPAVKNSVDIDVLVHPCDAVRAADILSDLGYACAYPPHGLDDRTLELLSPVMKEAVFVSPHHQVDLHWALVNQGTWLGSVDPWAEPLRVELLPGHGVSTLPDVANLAYLAVHGAASGWSRLKWIADFSAFLHARAEADRERLCKLARDATDGRAVDQALILVERLLGPGLVPPPARHNARAAARLASIAVTIIELRQPGKVLENGWRGRLGISRSRWMLRSGLAHRLSETLHAFRRQEVPIRLRWPLPLRLRWLYAMCGPFGLLAGLVSFARRRA